MDSDHLDLIPEEALLVNLKRYLNYQLSTFLLFALSFFSILLIFLLTAAALIFIPYMTYVLYKNKKYGWILTMLIIIIFPSILLIIILQQPLTLLLFLLIELAFFYFYCFTLRMVVNDWVQEITMTKLIDYQRQRKLEKEESNKII